MSEVLPILFGLVLLVLWGSVALPLLCVIVCLAIAYHAVMDYVIWPIVYRLKGKRYEKANSDWVDYY